MAREEDERLWAPDADVTFEHREPARFVTYGRSDALASSRPPRIRRWRQQAFVAAAVVAVTFVTVAMITSDGRDQPIDSAAAGPDEADGSRPPEFEILPTPRADPSGAEESDAGDDVVIAPRDPPLRFVPAQCLRHRLPRSIDPRWVVDLPSDHASGGQESIGDEVVLLPIRKSSSSDSSGAVELLALDLVDGSERWRLGLGSGAKSPPEIVDIFAGVAVVRLRDDPSGVSTLVGISERSGVELWRRELESGIHVLADPTDGLLVVHDTVVADALDDDLHNISWFDPVTFQSMNSMVGRFLGLGRDGSVTVVRDGVVSVVRARGGVVVEASWSKDGDPSLFTVLGSGVLVAEEGSLDLNEANPSGGWLKRPVDVDGSDRIDPPSRIISLDAFGDSSVVVGSPGAVYGAAMTPNSIELRWRRGGTVIGGESSDRGRTLLLRRDDVAVTDIVDASTGRTIIEVSRPPVVSLYANGVLVAGLRESVEPAPRTAYDLDGRELWTLEDTIALVVGDRVVVALAFARDVMTEDGSRPPLQITAFGRVPDEPSSCDRAVRN